MKIAKLRAPLNAILGFSELIERKMDDPLADKYIEYAHDIHRSGKHPLELINDVLDFSKLGAGKLELQEFNISLSQAVDNCPTLIRGPGDAGQVQLTTDLAPDLRCCGP